jgi:hypothetical protein
MGKPRRVEDGRAKGGRDKKLIRLGRRASFEQAWVRMDDDDD